MKPGPKQAWRVIKSPVRILITALQPRFGPCGIPHSSDPQCTHLRSRHEHKEKEIYPPALPLTESATIHGQSTDAWGIWLGCSRQQQKRLSVDHLQEKSCLLKKSVKQRKRSKDLTVHCHRRKCTRRQQNYTGESVKSVWKETQRERQRERGKKRVKKIVRKSGERKADYIASKRGRSVTGSAAGS